MEVITMADDVKWDEPVPFNTFERKEFPIEHLPGLLADIANSVADVTQTPVDAAGLASLAMISTAAARKFYIPVTEGDGWKEQNNLYMVIAMPPGERKSAVFSLLAKPILAYEKELQKERLQRLVADDATPQALAELLEENNERIAILSTEPGLFDMLSFRQYGKPVNLDVHLKGFTWDRITIDRKRDEPIILEQPCLTMCLFAQPSALNGLPERLTGRGLLGRFLYALPSSRRGDRDITLKSVPSELSAQYAELLNRLLKINPSEPIPITLSKETFDSFQKFRSEFEPKLKEGGELSHDFLSSWTERLPGQLLRIAITFHIVLEAQQGDLHEEEINRTISRETMDHALGFSGYLIEHAKAAFGCIKSDANVEDAKYLLDVLERKRKLLYKRQELWSLVKGKFHSAIPFDTALSVLETRGYIRSNIVKAQRGRAGSIIECNPLVVQTDAMPLSAQNAK
jgi:hypothetical protein